MVTEAEPAATATSFVSKFKDFTTNVVAPFAEIVKVPSALDIALPL